MDSFGSLNNALGRRSSLRKSFAGIDSGRRGEIEDSLSDIDPKRFRSLYRDRLAQIAETEKASAPLDDRATLEKAIANPSMDPATRDLARAKLRNMPGKWGSYEQQNDPNRYGTIASRNMPSLYRGR